ncbi:penicillin acylase family protein [Candidatus Kapabacteria bacterium]|nr:penicillin acylase family protein [Candidatus Kapabacteria bacterium]
MKKIWVYIIILMIGMLALSFFIASLLRQENSPEISSKFIANETVINFNQFGVPFISGNEPNQKYYQLGICHAKDRLLQMDYYLSICLGLMSERFSEKYILHDYISRRLKLSKLAKDIYLNSSKKEKEILKAYTSGVNDFIESSQSTFELAIFNVEPLRWEPWHPVLINLLIEMSNVNIFDNLKTYSKIYNTFDADIYNKVLETGGLENDFDVFYGLKSSYLKLIYDYFNELPKISFEDINFKSEQNLDTYFYYSQKANLKKGNEAYLAVFDSTINLSIPGNPLSLCEIDSNFSIYRNRKLKVNLEKIQNDGVNFLLQDSILEVKYLIDTIKSKENKISYLLDNTDYNIINFNDNTYILSINLTYDSIKSYDISENPFVKKRVKSLLKNVVKLTPIETQLISNDNYSVFYSSFKDQFYKIMVNFNTVLSNEEKLFIKEVYNWNCLVEPSSKILLFLDSLKIEIFSYLTNNLAGKTNTEVNLSNSFIDNFVINSLINNSIYFDDNNTNDTENKDIVIFNIFKKIYGKKLDDNVKYLKAKSIESELMANKVSFFDKEYLPKGDPYSIRYFKEENLPIGNIVNLIYIKGRNELYYQNFSGQSGNKLSKNYSDLFRIWQTGGFVKFNLENPDFDSQLIIKKVN